jgi:hypothetical protein
MFFTLPHSFMASCFSWIFFLPDIVDDLAGAKRHADGLVLVFLVQVQPKKDDGWEPAVKVLLGLLVEDVGIVDGDEKRLFTLLFLDFKLSDAFHLGPAQQGRRRQDEDSEERAMSSFQRHNVSSSSMGIRLSSVPTEISK